MSRLPSPLPPVVASTLFAMDDARAAGISESRLRRLDLERPLRGVRAPVGTVRDLETLCRAALLVLPAGSSFSHGTALRLLGAEVPTSLDTPTLHVRVPADAVRPERRGVVSHASTRTLRTVMLDGLPVSAPEQAWAESAELVGVDELVVVADALLRRRDPLTTLSALHAVVREIPAGRRGVARLRTALPNIRERTDSLMESRTRLTLVRAGLPCPEVNVPVHDAAGRFLAMPDLTYREPRLALEYDGDVHRTERATWMRDIRRRESLQAAGWAVMTVVSDDVQRFPYALAGRVRALLRTRTEP